MRTFIRLKNRPVGRLPDALHPHDVRYADDLVATFLQEYTKPGDLVFDPFAGFGTTLIVAEALGRRASGIEFDLARVEYIRTRLREKAAIIHGDSRELARYPLPAADFLMTSPPFMARGDAEDPLQSYGAPGEGYDAYLAGMERIAAQLPGILKPGARAVFEVSNLKQPEGVTTLAWDIAQLVARHLAFEGEVVIGWDRYGYGYDHSYCTVFRRER
ncbi:MAG TPA: DNA methyltransferase [Tepidiformaceae bacterium]|nr:DNA methyltransferase [Tepidiformaceae bacterium]